MPRRITTEKFIERAISIHGTIYDYSKSTYISSRTPVTIICPIHGEFEKTPQEHISARCGCSKCFFDKKRNSLSRFIQLSRETHGDKYDYSGVDYKTNLSRVSIRCPIHGMFQQRAGHHLSGRGCPSCGVSDQTKSLDRFIFECKNVHSEKYDYSNVVYVNCKTKVEIICKKHGPFSQRPSDHLRGQGCPRCGHGRISKMESDFLDELRIPKEFRQYSIDGTRLQVDGFNPQTGTVYEFLGDYWHGNPKIYSRSTLIKNTKLTCGDAFDRTIDRFNRIVDAGLAVHYIWESDWKSWKRHPTEKISIREYNNRVEW